MTFGRNLAGLADAREKVMERAVNLFAVEPLLDLRVDLERGS